MELFFIGLNFLANILILAGNVMKEKKVVTGKSSIRKWKLWRTSSGSKSGTQNFGNASETSSVADGFNAAVAIVVHGPAEGFQVAREEWDAIRIQIAFRGFLVRRALRALKGVVRHWYEAGRINRNINVLVY